MDNASTSKTFDLYTSNKILHFVIRFFVELYRYFVFFTLSAVPIAKKMSRGRVTAPSFLFFHDCKFSSSDLPIAMRFHSSGSPGAIIGKRFSVSAVGWML